MLDKQHTIFTKEELRKVIPPAPKILDKRIQPKLDFFSREFLSYATVAIIGSSNTHIPMTPLDYKERIKILNDHEIEVNNLTSITDVNQTIKSCQASLFILVAGIGHSLRINGVLEKGTDQKVLFKISSVYFHCARASARSGCWDYTNHIHNRDLSTKDILKLSPYIILKTADNEGNTELSPRGDEAGFIQQINENTLFIPERPGNKVAVSLRNILQNPTVELLLMVPGLSYTLNIHANAHVTNDLALLQRCTVNGKQPKLGILITNLNQSFQDNNELKQSGLWHASSAVDQKAITTFSKALSSHMNGTGLLGKATNTFVGAIVKHDMKHLY